MKKIALILILGVSSNLFAAEKKSGSSLKIKYQTESCSCEAQIDPKKYNAEEVKSVFAFQDLFYKNPKTMMWTKYGEASAEDLKKHREAYLKESQRHLDELKAYPLPPGKTWEDVRQDAIYETDLNQRLEVATLNLFEKNDVAILFEKFHGQDVPKNCAHQAEMLKSDANTMKLHEELMDDRCRSTKNPTQCLSDATITRMNKTKTKAEAFSFGWYNCVNSAWRKTSSKYQEAREQIEKDLLKKKCSCDEP